jgi:hypothetical protein
LSPAPGAHREEPGVEELVVRMDTESAVRPEAPGGAPVATAENDRQTDRMPALAGREVDLTSDQIEASSVSEGIARGRRTMSEPSKAATMAKGKRSSSRQSATSSGWTP